MLKYNVVKVEQNKAVMFNHWYEMAEGVNKYISHSDGYEDACGLFFRKQTRAYSDPELNPDIPVICPACKQDRFKEITVESLYNEGMSQADIDVYQEFVEAISGFTGDETFLICNHCHVSNRIESYDYGGKLSVTNFAIRLENIAKLLAGRTYS